MLQRARAPAVAQLHPAFPRVQATSGAREVRDGLERGVEWKDDGIRREGLLAERGRQLRDIRAVVRVPALGAGRR